MYTFLTNFILRCVIFIILLTSIHQISNIYKIYSKIREFPYVTPNYITIINFYYILKK